MSAQQAQAVAAAERPRRKQRGGVPKKFPEVITYKTTLTHVERLRHARETRSINVSDFIRHAVERALDELEGRTAAPRRLPALARPTPTRGGY